MFKIANPLFLSILISIPILVIVQLKSLVEATQWRKITTLIFRIVTLVCLVLALAGLHRSQQKASLAIAFILDVSESIPILEQQKGINEINKVVDSLRPTDRFTVIPFATQASIGLPLRAKLDQPKLTWELLSEIAIDSERTDIAASFQLAIYTLPDNRPRRIVLLSDGLQNMGDLNSLIDLAHTSGVEVFTVPLNSEREDEVWVRELRVPARVKIHQTFAIRAIVECGRAQQVWVQVFRNNEQISELQMITLKPGKQEISLSTQQLDKEGIYRYQVKIPIDDGLPQNNEAYAFVRVVGQPQVLYVEANQPHDGYLKHILEEHGFSVTVIAPREFPAEAENLQGSDVILLSNASAEEFSETQMAMIESHIRDFGKGLVVVGGDRAFGNGGYNDTPLEKVLPVEMTPRQRREPFALMFVIDTSGSMANFVGANQKIQLAIEGVRTAVRTLDNEDMAGVISFGAKIGQKISPTTKHEMIIREVGKLRPTGGTKMYPALKQAFENLKKVDAKQKHIILLSDGRSDGDFDTLASQIAANQIYITTISIGDAAEMLMKEIAELGKGTYLSVQNVSQLPKLLTEEVQKSRKYTIQETFQPIITESGSAILAGITKIPRLHGYVATSSKQYAGVFVHSHKEDPILSAWSYGLGRSVAFTSNAKSGWATDWIEWEQFGKFWAQVVNWTAPAAEGNPSFDLTVSRSNGVGEVVIDVPSVGKSENSHTLDVRVGLPRGAGEAVEMQRVTPTEYRGKFSIGERGVYSVAAQRKRGQEIQSSRRTSFAVSYPAEFGEFGVDHRLLSILSERTNGIYQATATQISQHTGELVEERRMLSHSLLMVAIFLFVFEMIFHRFSFSGGYLSKLSALLMRFRPGADFTQLRTVRQLSERKTALRQGQRGTTGEVVPGGQASHAQNSRAGNRRDDGNMGRLMVVKRRAATGINTSRHAE